MDIRVPIESLWVGVQVINVYKNLTYIKLRCFHLPTWIPSNTFAELKSLTAVSIECLRTIHLLVIRGWVPLNEVQKKSCMLSTSRCSAQTHILTMSLFLCSCLTVPLVHHGCHFGWTVHVLCNILALLTNALLRLGEQAGEPEELFTYKCV